MATCPTCGKTGFGIFEIKQNKCPSCRRAEAQMDAETRAEVERKKEEVRKTAKTLPITTEAWAGDEVERLGVVASEVVFGMNVFKDALAGIRDIVGGRSGAVQNTLRDAREAAFEEISVQAAELGADAVIAVDINYHSMSTTGGTHNMMMVAVSGTAIKRRASAD